MTDALALYKRITTVVRSLVRGDAMIDDVVQELWLWAWRRGVEATTLTYVELKHRAWDVLRRERRHEHEDLTAARDVAVAEGPETSEDAQRLCEVLDGEIDLSILEQTVLIRRYWFGDSIKSTAERIGQSPEVVALAEARALARIAQELYRKACDEQ